MAQFHLCVHPIVSRGKGHSLARAAAYNMRTRLNDERTGETHDYSRRRDLLHSEILVPPEAPAWGADLQSLVTGVGRAEKRRDAQLARNLDIALPAELSLDQNKALLREFVREAFGSRGYVAAVAIHAAPGDPRNIHAHIIVPLRKLGTEGFAATRPEAQETFRRRRVWTEDLRATWEMAGNRHLEAAGFAPTLDRRSYLRRGIDRVAGRHLGPALSAVRRRLGAVYTEGMEQPRPDGKSPTGYGAGFFNLSLLRKGLRSTRWARRKWRADRETAARRVSERRDEMGFVRRALHASRLRPDRELTRWETAERIADRVELKLSTRETAITARMGYVERARVYWDDQSPEKEAMGAIKKDLKRQRRL